MGAKKGTNNNGGPATDAGAARALANLQSPPDPQAATKHGLSSYLDGKPGAALAPPCNRCVARDDCDAYTEGATCRLAEAMLGHLVAAVMAEPQVRPIDAPLAVSYARVTVAIETATRWLGRVGPYRDDGDTLEAQPLLRELPKLYAQQLKLADALGLSPLARKRLQDSGSGGDTMAKLARALEDMNRRQQEQATGGAVDADFEAEEGRDADTTD